MLERQTYGKVEGKVALEAGMKEGEMLVVVSLEGGIDGFHTQVEADRARESQIYGTQCCFVR